MHSIFLSYRREDSSGVAGRLYDRLTEVFGQEHVFMDIDSIDAGDDFMSAIARTLDECEAVLVVIGKRWLGSSSGGSSTRLDDPNDFVRLEIEQALRKRRLVIPVLIDGATVPSSDLLPDSLSPLIKCNAVSITHHTFGRDVHALIARLRKGIVEIKRDRTSSPTWLIEAGVEVRQTRFRFSSFFAEGNEFILSGTNFGDQMGNRGTPPGILHRLIVNAIKRNAHTSVYLIIAPFELLEKMIPNSIADLQGRSAARLKMLQHDPRLAPQERARLHVFDHRGATFLSVALRDPNVPAERRGLAVVTTRWFKDEAGPQRMFFAIEEAVAPEVFKAFVLPIYPSIKVDEVSLSKQDDRTMGGRNIDQICSALGVDDDPFMAELATHPL
jgi:hypothetical protein